ncbi:MAG TPA: methyltransferase domain-containing protein [Azospirillaceae bacterium]|nr:methyltransferase domain-containing protein [Azospirillaceae bacterium]
MASPADAGFRERDGRRYFLDNVTGTVTHCAADAVGRETAAGHTGTNMRTRALVYALLKALDLNTVLPANPPARHIRGIGLSDQWVYAKPLSRLFDYRNTWYHRRPRLDVSDEAACAAFRDLDFIVSSDVFEHVPPPVRRTFANCRRMLKPGGALVFSVPYTFAATVEHFPDLHRWRLRRPWFGRPVLVNETADGRRWERDDLVFHGGLGATLEMRVFGLEDLKEDLAAAGFSSVEVVAEDVPLYGIWNRHELWSLPIIARA